MASEQSKRTGRTVAIWIGLALGLTVVGDLALIVVSARTDTGLVPGYVRQPGR
ncbi:MAG: hypothetical protein FJZ01_19100 [Candidatus Sericytochromatia bacterium]|nr:hypothetical protein [Candidatus Tanganyikabacteria bacterium]